MAADEITYPINRMQQTAQKIKTNAQQAYERHVMAWRNVEALIEPFPRLYAITLTSRL